MVKILLVLIIYPTVISLNATHLVIRGRAPVWCDLHEVFRDIVLKEWTEMRIHLTFCHC